MVIQDKPTTSMAVRDDAKTIVVSPGRPAYPVRAQAAFGISPGGWRALVDAVFPTAETTEAVELALAYCRARNLDIFKRPVHIVGIWSKSRRAIVESVWPGIGELRTTAARTGQHAGFDEAVFGPEETRTFRGTVSNKDTEKTVSFPLWCSIVAYRLVNGQRVAFPGPKVRWLETYASMGQSDVPNEMWETRPYGQIEKCAEAAALRRAFPEEIGSDYIPEEVGRGRFGQTIDVTPATAPPGAKTKALADRLKAVKEEPVAEEQEPRDDEEWAGETIDETQEGERLSPAQVTEIQALVKRSGVSLDDLEGRYGDNLAEITMAGMDAKALEADIVATLKDLAKAAKPEEGQLPLGKK